MMPGGCGHLTGDRISIWPQHAALPMPQEPDATNGIPSPSDGAGIMGSWIDQELAGCKFADARLGKRFSMLMDQL